MPKSTEAANDAPTSDPEPDPEPPQTPGSEAPSGRGLLTLDVVHDAEVWSGIARIEQLIKLAVDALQAEVDIGAINATATILLTSDAEVRTLNAKWRGIDKATNVLSFPAPDAPGDLESDDFLGDIAMAGETVLREAAEQGAEPAHHLQHLTVHGLLHLLGYDHENSDDATEMETLEIDILARIGVPNPYTGSELA
jgi:probable rRNA maturation factor